MTCLLLPLLGFVQGGMVLVSHDFRLIDQVAKEIWECNNQVRLCAPRVLLMDTLTSAVTAPRFGVY